MIPDAEETIVAVGSAPGGSPRGIVRISGPRALPVVEQLAGRELTLPRASRVAQVSLMIELAGAERQVQCDLMVWPDQRSYTNQPTVELHTVGSPPVLEAMVRSTLDAGARLAMPGEFTLRAFLAGRMDLTQAEAVLAVIDAKHDRLLELALEQLAGGLSGPLNQLREDLLSLLADLEAGLDFVDEEDVTFIETDVLIERLQQAQQLVAEAEEKTELRHTATERPLVLLAGPPNVGKSRLFNTLVKRYGSEEHRVEALVADQPGVTRDALSAEIVLDGIECQLADSAGVSDDGNAISPIDAVAQERVASLNEQADLVLKCRPAGDWILEPAIQVNDSLDETTLHVATMADRLPVALLSKGRQSKGCQSKDRQADGLVLTSAADGTGITELVQVITRRLSDAQQASASQVVSQTAARCRESLGEARHALEQAIGLAAVSGGDELVSLEIRMALDALARVVGVVVTDDILDQIFGKFCIGK